MNWKNPDTLYSVSITDRVVSVPESCGPQLAKEYRLDDTHYTFSFHLKPEIL